MSKGNNLPEKMPVLNQDTGDLVHTSMKTLQDESHSTDKYFNGKSVDCQYIFLIKVLKMIFIK